MPPLVSGGNYGILQQGSAVIVYKMDRMLQVLTWGVARIETISFFLNGRAAVACFRLASPCASATVVRSLAASIEMGNRYYRLSNVPRRRGSRRRAVVLQLVFDRKKDTRDTHAHTV